MDLRAATVIATGGLNKAFRTEGWDLKGHARTLSDLPESFFEANHRKILTF